MSKYSTGTATGPGAAAALQTAINAALLANGWTSIDTIASNDVVYKGAPLDATANNYPIIRVTWATTTRIDFRVYTDWDTTAHAGENETGNVFSTTGLTVQDSSFVYWMRVNSVSLAICAKISTQYNKIYCGFLRRSIPLARSGMTKLSGGASIGATSLSVASNMTGLLQVGQTIQLINFAHNDGSANKAHIEKVTITSVGSSTIGVSALSNAYDTGALVGENIQPICVTGQFTGATPSSVFFPTEIDGTRSGSTSHQGSSNELPLVSYSQNAPNTGWGEYGPALMDCTMSTSGKSGARGYFYSCECICRGSANPEDIFTDGNYSFIVLGLGSSIVVCFGPRET